MHAGVVGDPLSGAVLGRELAFNEINHLSLAMIFENIHLI